MTTTHVLPNGTSFTCTVGDTRTTRTDLRATRQNIELIATTTNQQIQIRAFSRTRHMTAHVVIFDLQDQLREIRRRPNPTICGPPNLGARNARQRTIRTTGSTSPELYFLGFPTTRRRRELRIEPQSREIRVEYAWRVCIDSGFRLNSRRSHMPHPTRITCEEVRALTSCRTFAPTNLRRFEHQMFTVFTYRRAGLHL